MKKIMLLIIWMMYSSCYQPNKKTPMYLNYPDYPPLVINNHLEAEYDLAKWYLYVFLARLECYDLVSMRDRIAQVNDKGIKISECGVILDTLTIHGDTALFAIRMVANDSMYCDCIRRHDGSPWGISSKIAVSIKEDTLICKHYRDKSRVSISAQPNSVELNFYETLLNDYVQHNPNKLHPWLYKKARECGWLP